MEQELKLLEWIGIGTDISCSGQLWCVGYVEAFIYVGILYLI